MIRDICRDEAFLARQAEPPDNGFHEERAE